MRFPKTSLDLMHGKYAANGEPNEHSQISQALLDFL